jgi:uncharacterized DUF497 family protein
MQRRRGVLFRALRKSRWNKHGVSFETACEPFFDFLADYEDASLNEEHRLALIGVSLDRKLLYVVHLQPKGNLI